MAKSKRPKFPGDRRLRPRVDLVEERILLSSFVVSNTQDSGAGSLRHAISDSDGVPGPNTITFQITPAASSYVINLLTPLPPITRAVLLDGTSQPGYNGTPLVEINGGGMQGDGLLLAPGSDGSTIQGLDIAGFPDSSFTDGAGIHIQSNGNLIQSNFLGTDLTGKAAGPGDYFGVFIDGINGASENTIGAIGSTAFSGNLISGNAFDGILIYDDGGSAHNNLVIGNKIGTDVSGSVALPNTGDGIDLFGSSNTVGGTTVGSGNLVSANGGPNGGEGINLSFASDNLVEGNVVGTTFGQITDPPSKFQRLGNTASGIFISSGNNNTIGGSITGSGNLVVANGNDGIEINSGSDFNVVSGNAVGTTLATGSSIGIGPPVNLGNASEGISVVNSSGNTIGGTDQLDAKGNITLRGGNVVSSNGQSGIFVSGNDSFLGSGKQGNVILGNLVGTSADGSVGVGNASIGVTVGDSANNTIGGVNVLNPDGSLSGFSGNLISGNQSDGLQFNQTGTTGNLVIGNRIGSNLTGTRALPNSDDGVLIKIGASKNTIGAANLDGSAANLISGNSQNGIDIQGTSTSNDIVGNRIGLLASGMAALPNLGDGIVLNAAGNVVGGSAVGAGNVISGNLGSGVRVTNLLPLLPPTNADKNQIVGNLIGLNVTGVSSGVGNVESGVEIDNASGTTIGGVTAVAGAGTGNVIAGNRQAGIKLTGSSTATVIEGNLVGLNAGGTAGQGNLLSGILLENVSRNTIGGSTAGAGNVLSNNSGSGLEIDQGSGSLVQGNLIGTDISGTSAGGNLQNGLTVSNSTTNTISGNVLSGNNLSGLLISGAGATGNVAVGNKIGTDRSGVLALDNGSNGVTIESASANTVGGMAAGSGNLISGNRAQGLEIIGTAAAPAQFNVVTGNLIGTSGSGAAPLGNAQDGVFLSSGSTGNTIGGRVAGSGNVISANQANGVELFGGATGNQVAGNLIGTDLSGELALGNSNVGVAINSASGNTIGGPTASTGHGAGNLISGNRSSGVLISGTSSVGNQVEGNLIGTDVTGGNSLPNSSSGVSIDSAPENLIGGDLPGDGNVIAANRTFGVLVLGGTAKGNRLAGNLIGTNDEGALSLGNALDGVVLNAAPDNVIGGLTAAARNVISGNAGNGINVLNIAGAGGIAILGNFIGTDPTGQHALGNGLDGVLLNGVSGTFVDATAIPNVISGNAGSGIHVLGTAATGTVVEGSLIGTNLAGSVPIPNGGDGVFLDNSGLNTIGGTAVGLGNLISGNAGHGVQITGTSANGNVVGESVIGTDAIGTSALPNGGFGISIESSSDTLVQSDLISGNSSGGVQITGIGAQGNRVYGSSIGTDRAGEIALSNGLAVLNNGIGVFINGAAGNSIGGTASGQGNLISGNSTAGVYIFGRFAAANTVVGNLIGTDASGSRPILNSAGSPIQQVGLLINQAPGLDLQDVNPGPGNTVGGLTSGARNVISGNIVGIEISGNDSRGNLVAGNFIGPSASGGAGAGNTVGVYINGAPGNLIGSGNVVSGNSRVGVYILGSPSTGNQVTGNLIGVGPDGVSRLPNQTGIYIENAPGNVIGGPAAASGNVISANTIAGVYILAAQSVGNLVESNLIGFAANGSTRLGNGEYGVLLYNAPSNTVVRSGPTGNRIVGSGIANFRVFIGRPVTANPPGGQSSQTSKGRHGGSQRPTKARLVVGSPSPEGPVRGKKSSTQR
jgi:hypothetical protein